MKTLTVEDFKLSPEGMKTIVSGSQKFLAPDAEGEDLPLTSDHKPTS